MSIDNNVNESVISYLKKHSKRVSMFPAVAKPESVVNPYFGSGSHPEIVQRVWDTLGSSLPTDCRCLVHGTPALVVQPSDIILAMAWGTEYILKIVPSRITSTEKRLVQWTDGGTFDAARDLGEGWILGEFGKDEIIWLREVYDMYVNHPNLGAELKG